MYDAIFSILPDEPSVCTSCSLSVGMVVGICIALFFLGMAIGVPLGVVSACNWMRNTQCRTQKSCTKDHHQVPLTKNMASGGRDDPPSEPHDDDSQKEKDGTP